MRLVLIGLLLFSVSQSIADVAINFKQDSWKEIKLGKSEPNSYQFGNQLKIIVKKSSSPIVYKFDEVQEFSELQFEASVDGVMNPNAKTTAFEEDSFLQFGFVVVGDNQLGAMGKLFAPKWVSEIFALAPEGMGLDKIYFYNVATKKESVNQERQSPKSKYMFERIILTKDDLGKTVSYTLLKKLKTTALWINAEGESTDSEFTTTINKIVLK